MNDRMIELGKDALILLVIALLAAVATLPTRAQGARELSLADVLIALRSKKADIGEKNKILTEAVRQRGITFTLTPEIEKELGGTGAANELIAAIREKMPVVSGVQTPAKSAPAVVKPVEDLAFFRDRAAAELKSGNNDAAIADLEKAIGMDPKDAGVRHDHAMLLAVKGDLESAANEYSRAAELAPQDVRNFIGRANVFERMGRPADALTDYQRVLSLNPADNHAAGAVVRISAAMTKAAMDLAAKQQTAAEKRADAATTQINGAKDTANANADQAITQTSDPSTGVEATSPVSAGNLMNYCTDLVKPTYPQQAKALRAGGDVSVRVTLDADGHVVDAKATSGLGSLRAAAESAARRSKFKPVVRNGKPVAATGTMNYSFKM